MTIELVRQKADPQRVEESFLHMKQRNGEKWCVETRAGGIPAACNRRSCYPQCFAFWAWSRPADGIDRERTSKMLLGWLLGPLQRQPTAAHHSSSGCRNRQGWDQEEAAKARLCIFLAERFSLEELCHQSTDGKHCAWACWVLLWQRRLVRRSPLDSSSWCDQGADASTGEGIPGQLACLGWTGSVRPSKFWWQLDLAGTVVVFFFDFRIWKKTWTTQKRTPQGSTLIHANTEHAVSKVVLNHFQPLKSKCGSGPPSFGRSGWGEGQDGSESHHGCNQYHNLIEQIFSSVGLVLQPRDLRKQRPFYSKGHPGAKIQHNFKGDTQFIHGAWSFGASTWLKPGRPGLLWNLWSSQ